MQPIKHETAAFKCHDKSVLEKCSVNDQFYISSTVLLPFTHWSAEQAEAQVFGVFCVWRAVFSSRSSYFTQAFRSKNPTAHSVLPLNRISLPTIHPINPPIHFNPLSLQPWFQFVHPIPRLFDLPIYPSVRPSFYASICISPSIYFFLQTHLTMHSYFFLQDHAVCSIIRPSRPIQTLSWDCLPSDTGQYLPGGVALILEMQLRDLFWNFHFGFCWGAAAVLFMCRQGLLVRELLQFWKLLQSVSVLSEVSEWNYWSTI